MQHFEKTQILLQADQLALCKKNKSKSAQTDSDFTLAPSLRVRNADLLFINAVPMN